MDTREQIVRCADRLQRQRGYAGWSFADVSDEVGIRKASIHHHFPTKGALLSAVVALHHEEGRQLARALSGQPPRDRLLAFFSGYPSLLERDLLCPTGALTVDWPGLPPEVRPAVDAYVADLRAWLVDLLGEGQRTGQIRATASPEDQARLVLATLQGALQQARALRDPEALRAVVAQLSALLLEVP